MVSQLGQQSFSINRELQPTQTHQLWGKYIKQEHSPTGELPEDDRFRDQRRSCLHLQSGTELPSLWVLADYNAPATTQKGK